MEQTSNKYSPFPGSGAGKTENHCATTFSKPKDNAAKGKKSDVSARAPNTIYFSVKSDPP